MICGILIVSGLLSAAQSGPENPAGVAERITLRDGSTALGLITSVTGGQRGAVEFLVRRDWAGTHLPKWSPRWERAVDAGARTAAKQRSERLAAWRRQRAAGRPADDRIVGWIDDERKRLEAPGRMRPSMLIPVHLPRVEVRAIARQSQADQRLLQLGWLCGIADVESRSRDALAGSLEGRGFSPDGPNTPSLDRLIPLTLEPEVAWLARRAATELAVDPDLRFVRHRDLVLPDRPPAQGQPAGLGGLDLSSALGELGRLLDPEPGPREDPLVAVLKKVGESGRVGVVVTRLELPADLSQASVESTLWVRVRAEHWVPYVSRTSAVRPEAVVAEAGSDLAEDPQVKAAFSVVEGLGLGKLDPALKERSLKMGAATQQALGAARAALAEDLNRLMMPIFEPVTDREGETRPGPGTDAPGPTNRPEAPGTEQPRP